VREVNEPFEVIISIAASTFLSRHILAALPIVLDVVLYVVLDAALLVVSWRERASQFATRPLARLQIR
jgi:hypothetical protein